VPGSKFFDPGWVGTIFCCSGQVESGPSEVEYGIGKYILLKIPNFSIFSLQVKKISSGWVKDKSASYLQQVKNMLGSGEGPSPVQDAFFKKRTSILVPKFNTFDKKLGKY